MRPQPLGKIGRICAVGSVCCELRKSGRFSQWQEFLPRLGRRRRVHDGDVTERCQGRLVVRRPNARFRRRRFNQGARSTIGAVRVYAGCGFVLVHGLK
jgi:hypothetical protein